MQVSLYYQQNNEFKILLLCQVRIVKSYQNGKVIVYTNFKEDEFVSYYLKINDLF